MKLTIHLFKEDISTFDECLRDLSQDPKYSLDAVDPKEPLSYEAQGHIVSIRERVPRWETYIHRYFPMDDCKNGAYGFLLLLRTEGRFFGITLGYGFLGLNRHQLERNFGLLVCANSLDPKKLKAMDSRSIDIVTKQQRTVLSQGSPLLDFGVEIDQEWVHYLSGYPIDSSIGKSLSGSDSLRINITESMEGLERKCKTLLQLFQSDAYRDQFGFLDNLKPIKRDELIVGELNKLLSDKVANRSLDQIAMALPELIVEDTRFSHFSIAVGRKRKDIFELALHDVYAFLDENSPIQEPLDRVKVIAIDEDGEPCSKSHTLFECLVAEFELDDTVYSCSAGFWFEIKDEYAAQIRQNIRNITDLSEVLLLPDMGKGENEGEYNCRVGMEKGWTILDKRNVNLNEPYQRVEVCDLLTAANQFICVKKMSRSSTLSHLFAQGSVSAQLLRSHRIYRQEIQRILEDPRRNFEDPKPCIVFGIATEKTGALAQGLFLFSAINLFTHFQAIQKCGYDVALAKIHIG